MKQRAQTWRSFAIIAVLLGIPASGSADTVADWNAIAVQATVTAARAGPSGVLDLAMVQAAVHDAVQGIERRFKPYHVEIPGASGSPEAAAAKAAHGVLVSRFPAQAAALDTTYQQYLLDHGLAATDPGVQVGATAAAGIIALRALDGSFPEPPPPPFTGGTGPGVWRPTPPGNLPMAAPWLGNVTPFTLTAASQFSSAPPPALGSDQYAADYNEVKALGALDNSSRTPQQTELAQFWAANYIVLWNQTLRDIAAAHVDHIADSARLFALADMAIADALITSWNSKSQYSTWRPITAIREGNSDDPRTPGDPSWLPLITTPNYPDHTSGANNFTAAATGILALFFGTDDMTFSVTTTNLGPTQEDTRTYARFSDAAQEVVDGRIYQGIHFRFADEAARTQGRQVATWAFENHLRPLDDGYGAGREDDRVGCRFAPGSTSAPAGLAPVALLLGGLAAAVRRLPASARRRGGGGTAGRRPDRPSACRPPA
jgi:hypothetical protein